MRMPAANLRIALLALLGSSLLMPGDLPAEEFRRLSVDEYRDKMAAGWIGQMAGVGWGGPTEFKCKGEIIPRGQDARRGSRR